MSEQVIPHRAANENERRKRSSVAPYPEASETAGAGSRRSSGASSNLFGRLVVASSERDPFVDERVGRKPLGDKDQEEFQDWDFNPYVFRNITALIFLGWLMYTISAFDFYRFSYPLLVSHTHCEFSYPRISTATSHILVLISTHIHCCVLISTASFSYPRLVSHAQPKPTVGEDRLISPGAGCARASWFRLCFRYFRFFELPT